tara:strand:+ start:236 stop:433 length:198 start_codon:yes stop_codon:yes gene_type:complete
MAKKSKNEGSEFYNKGKKKMTEPISKQGELPYKKPATQDQSIKSFKLDYDVWTGDPVEMNVAERN